MQTLTTRGVTAVLRPPKTSSMPSVRTASPSDVPAIVRLHTISMPHFFWTAPTPAFLATFYRFVVHDKVGWLLISEQEGYLAGFVAGFPDPARLFQRIAAAKFRFFVAGAACLAKCPTQFRGVWSDIRRAVRLSREPILGSQVACELTTIAVQPQFRRQGHGRALVCALIEAAKTDRISEIHARIDPKDKGMSHFYRRLGFEAFCTLEPSDTRWAAEHVLKIRTE